MAEAFLAYQMAARGIPGRVSSAGLYRDGQGASPNGVMVAARKGHDLSQHRSRRMTEEMLRDADLILGMERMHIREVVVLSHDAFPKSFTLKEVVRRGEQVGPRGIDEPVEAWLARVADGRRATDHLGSSPDDDVADPIGRPVEAYERTAAELDDLVRRMSDLLWPVRASVPMAATAPPPPPPPPPPPAPVFP